MLPVCPSEGQQCLEVSRSPEGTRTPARMDDQWGVPTSCATREGLAETNAFIRCVLRYGTDWAAGQRAAEREPASVLAHVLKADYHIARYRKRPHWRCFAG